MQIRQRTIRIRFIDPSCYCSEDFCAHRFRRHGCGEEFPVCFCVEVAGVEGEAVALEDGGVPGALHGVDVGRDEACFVSGRGWVEGFLGVVAGGGKGVGGGKGAAFEMEAEEGVGEEVVEGCPGAVPVVG